MYHPFANLSPDWTLVRYVGIGGLVKNGEATQEAQPLFALLSISAIA